MCEVSGHGDGDGHEGEGEVDGLGAVATVRLALTHVRVVLLEDGLVTVVLVFDVTAATDDAFVTTNVLEDFSADCVVLIVCRAFFQELFSLQLPDSALLLRLEPHRVGALGLRL